MALGRLDAFARAVLGMMSVGMWGMVWYGGWDEVGGRARVRESWCFRVGVGEVVVNVRCGGNAVVVWW